MKGGFDPRPIGVFDSGVGGLTVAAALAAGLPRERPLPRRHRPVALRHEVRRDGDPLHAGEPRLPGRRGVKAVVVACNTASALALEAIRRRGAGLGRDRAGRVRAAAASSRGRVGVIGTEATVRSDAYGRALRRCARTLGCISRPARSSCRWSRRAGSTIR